MVKIVLLILGVLISVIGIVNIMGNISTIHSYNRRKKIYRSTGEQSVQGL